MVLTEKKSLPFHPSGSSSKSSRFNNYMVLEIPEEFLRTAQLSKDKPIYATPFSCGFNLCSNLLNASSAELPKSHAQADLFEKHEYEIGRNVTLPTPKEILCWVQELPCISLNRNFPCLVFEIK